MVFLTRVCSSRNGEVWAHQWNRRLKEKGGCGSAGVRESWAGLTCTVKMDSAVTQSTGMGDSTRALAFSEHGSVARICVDHRGAGVKNNTIEQRVCRRRKGFILEHRCDYLEKLAVTDNQENTDLNSL